MKYLLPVLLVATSTTLLAEPKDPMSRDEDISRTQVHVEHNRLPGGLHEYIYTIDAPDSNLGVVSKFSVDLSCNVAFTAMRLPSPENDQGYEGNRAWPGSISPTVIDAKEGVADTWGIRHSGSAYWNVQVLPGARQTGMRLVSSVPPGTREFTLRPEWNTDSSEWDYPQEIMTGMPWVTDFVVTGDVIGPGCPDGPEPEKKTRKKLDPNGSVAVSTPEAAFAGHNVAL